ncbi:hypothetical protein NQ317_000493 [Molorchus minor]|uniref:Transposase n=1 Tax=Molorchus minor TaxID=1323400 RepID=A0ABQ9JBN8_9CUCU|nr:hypothetical protein NQ317_000493 [Molorchus minor]
MFIAHVKSGLFAPLARLTKLNGKLRKITTTSQLYRKSQKWGKAKYTLLMKGPEIVTTVVAVGPNPTHMICPHCQAGNRHFQLNRLLG